MNNIEVFNKWKEEQRLLGNLKLPNKYNKKLNKITWKTKYQKANSRGTHFLLTFEEYLYKAYEAGLTCPSQIGTKGNQDRVYNLSRFEDKGLYTVENCRFITAAENRRERDSHHNWSEKSKKSANYLVEQGIHPWQNVLPWEHPSTTRDSLEVWAKAAICYEWWLNTNLGYVTLKKHFNLKSRKACIHLIKKFKNGWNPKEDNNWISFFNLNYGKPQMANKNKKSYNLSGNSKFLEKTEKFKTRELKPLNKNQDKYIKSIYNNTITVSTGIAGSGKSYIASIIAADMFLSGEVDQLILARPTEGPSKPLGTLPGDINEKLQSWLTPLVSTIRKRMGPGHFDYHLSRGSIELLPLSQIKGRSFDDAFIIVDEAEDIDVETMKSLLTRIGDNTKMVINGDIKQVHIKQKSGLEYLLYLIRKYNLPVQTIEFTLEDCVRSKTTKMFLEAFEAEEDC